MNEPRFHDAIFQLADLYTETVDPLEYVTFLSNLLAKLKDIGCLGKGAKRPPPPRGKWAPAGGDSLSPLPSRSGRSPHSPHLRGRRTSLGDIPDDRRVSQKPSPTFGARGLSPLSPTP